MMMVSHSGKTGLWFSFNTGHLGFRGSVAFTLQEFMSNSVSAGRKMTSSLVMSKVEAFGRE